MFINTYEVFILTKGRKCLQTLPSYLELFRLRIYEYILERKHSTFSRTIIYVYISPKVFLILVLVVKTKVNNKFFFNFSSFNQTKKVRTNIHYQRKSHQKRTSKLHPFPLTYGVLTPLRLNHQNQIHPFPLS